MASSRIKVLGIFKKLHRTRQMIFEQDKESLSIVRNKINEEFRKAKNESDPEKIDFLTKRAEEAELYLRTAVIQMREVREGVFKPIIHKDTVLRKNKPFDMNEIPVMPAGRRPKCKPIKPTDKGTAS